MESITSQIQQLVKDKNYKKALSMVSKFRNCYNGADIKLIKSAYEMMVYPEFYKAMKLNLEKEIQLGVDELIKYYAK